MKKVLFFLIIVCMLFVSCKDKGNESASNPAATTPLEGTWKKSETDTTLNITTEQIFVFAGTNISFTFSMKDSSANPATTIMTLVYTGTFRLDNANLYVKFNAVSYTDTTHTTPITDPAAIASAMQATSLPMPADNTEFLLGTYAINGNQLTITSTSSGSTSTETFIKP